MSKEEIRKLLGGYATNTLSQSERSALFEAALEDQDLFNALQEEQALKTLLENPPARAEIRQALEQPRINATGLRWWAWTGAIGAVAAAVILLVVFRPNAPGPAEQRTQVASAERAPATPPATERSAQDAALSSSTAATQTGAPVPERSKALPQTRELAAAKRPRLPETNAGPAPAGAGNAESATTPAAPPPIIAQPVQAQSTIPKAESAAQSGARSSAGTLAQSQDRVALAYAPSAGLAGGSLQQPLLQYSLLRSDPQTQAFVPVPQTGLKPGDRVRLQVSPSQAGLLRLTSVSDSGQTRTLSEIEVLPAMTYTVPDPPIQASVAPQKFRLTLLPPNAPPQAIGTIAGSEQRTRAASASQAKTSGPASIEITVVAKP